MRHLRLPLLALASMLATSVLAEEIMEEIIITGEFRDVGLTEVGGSLSVLSVDAQADAVEHLEDVLGRIANVNFSSGASRARFIQIRGIGERGQFAEPLNASVGLLVDGVDLSGIGTVATLHDVQQVEVFRGPQGTLYGANALAGLINIVTKAPLEAWGGEVSLGLADYDSRTLGVVASGPLSDQLGIRLSVQQHDDDGFIDNAALGDDDTSNRDELTARVKLQFAGDVVDWQLNLGLIEVDNGYDAFSLDNNRTTLSDQPGEDLQDTHYFSLAVGWALSDAVELQASVGFVSSDIEYGYDEDWTFDGFHPFGYSSTDFYGRERDTTTVDVRLVSSGVGPLQWVAGLYRLDQEVSLQRIYTFAAADHFSDFNVDRVAAYGEVEYALSDHSRIKVGLRGERHSSHYDDSAGVRFSPDDNMLGGRVVYEQDVLEDAFIYVGLNRGYKAGGFNTDGTLDADLRQYDPEVLWNAEAGIKGWFADGRLRVAATLFYMLRRDVQVNTSTIRIRADNSAEFIDYVGNAAKGFNRGLELELEYLPNEELTLFASVGWLDTEYEDFVNGSGVVLDGREQAQAPSYQAYFGATWEFTPGWSAQIELEARDEYFFSDTHATKSDAYELLHASVGYHSERFEVRLWGRNLTDKDYFVRGFFFGNDPRDGYTARSFTQLGEPSRYGLSAKVRF